MTLQQDQPTRCQMRCQPKGHPKDCGQVGADSVCFASAFIAALPTHSDPSFGPERSGIAIKETAARIIQARLDSGTVPAD